MKIFEKHCAHCLATLGLVLMVTAQAPSFAAGSEADVNTITVASADTPVSEQPLPLSRKRSQVVQGPVKAKEYPTKPQKAVEKLR